MHAMTLDNAHPLTHEILLSDHPRHEAPHDEPGPRAAAEWLSLVGTPRLHSVPGRAAGAGRGPGASRRGPVSGRLPPRPLVDPPWHRAGAPRRPCRPAVAVHEDLVPDRVARQ